MHGTIVGVLRGGRSREHGASLKSGHSMLANLPRERFTVRDIYIDKSGTWHDRGLPTSPGKVLPLIDVAVICVHGPHGEVGELQKLLERFGIPYAGADSYHSFHAAHRVLAKERAKEVGLKTPRYRFTEQREGAEALAREAVRLFRQPVVVKTVDSGSWDGVIVAGGHKPVLDAVLAMFENGARGVLVEEFVRGVGATIGVVEGLRGQSLYVLPPVEILRTSGMTEGVYPGRFKREIADELMRAARAMHEALGQRHYSRTDFIVSDKGIYFLKLSPAAAVPMEEDSFMSRSLESVGVRLPEFATHVIDLARA